MLKIREEAGRCLLCERASCTAACEGKMDPAAMVRSVWFHNEAGAAAHIDKNAEDALWDAAENACIQYDRKIRLREIAQQLPPASQEHVDLGIDFCGVHCENPFFLSSSVVASGYEMCAKALDMGWAGIVYKTIGRFMPKEASPRFSSGVKSNGSHFEGFRNIEQISEHTLEYDLDVLRRLKENYPTKVIVASIMGSSEDEWRELGKLCTEAGCDIIECNFSCPHMTAKGLGADVGTNPELVERYTKLVKETAGVPVLAKMTPNITNMEIPAMAAVRSGADGIAAINTIKSITGFDWTSKIPEPAVEGKSEVSGYSGNAVKPIALRFIHDMKTCPQLADVPISGMGGIENWEDAADFIALGCTNVQVTTAVMQYGYRIIEDMIDGLSAFLAREGYKSLSEFAGTGLTHFINANDIDRDSMSLPVFDRKRCIGCGRCYVSCYDAGHQAIRFEEDRVPRLDGKKCVGCHLCRLVCPTDAIGRSKRIKKQYKIL